MPKTSQPTKTMPHPAFSIASAVALFLLLVFLCGCASRGVALRPTRDNDGKSLAKAPPAMAHYIETTNVTGPVVSCSFVEFDERGDYLDFAQHTNAWNVVRDLSKANPQGLLVIIYCHGWKNNVQSGDVVEFNHFLLQIARSKPVREAGHRVHGVYLGWRGNVVAPYVDTKSEDFRETTDAFGGPIVDTGAARTLKYFSPKFISENLCYWNRKGAAEDKVSGVPMARTIFTLAHAAKAMPRERETNQVFVIGHSFGALMLERSLGQACVGAITASWPWGRIELAAQASAPAPPLPFDGILFVNSAAPSIHTKGLADLLWAHRSALHHAGSDDWDAPVIISLTSSADWATGVAHRVANVLAPLYPSLQRNYFEGVLQTTTAEKDRHPAVQQSYFYERTPGHNPLLVNQWITNHPSPPPKDKWPANNHDAVLEHNLDSSQGTTNLFYTLDTKSGVTPWLITPEPVPPGWTDFKEHKPVQRGDYFIMRCGGRIIRGHGDIWSPTAMETYAGLIRMTYLLRQEAKRKLAEQAKKPEQQ